MVKGEEELEMIVLVVDSRMPARTASAKFRAWEIAGTAHVDHHLGQHLEDFCGDAPKRCGTTGNELHVSSARMRRP